ncbi:hypothetical protein J3R82DRAFT_4650 [Butyriboletus roseoflavus]|nr:hypothetical protein J3R82DRAFT_4650 [Butyriboletus roseoflavus]
MLANEFTQQTLLIRSALDSPGPDQHDRVYRLNIELQAVVTRIRELHGLSHFLLPSPFSDLQQAAHGGPVIIVNASEYGCDALIVLADQDPVHIPLSITKEAVRELSSELGTLTKLAKSMVVTKDLAIILRKLWDEVVSPIVNFLQTVHPFQSRIWWCPTAEFSLLPLHAAGPYRKGQRNLANLYISSYTPTLAALIRATRHDSLTFCIKGETHRCALMASPPSPASRVKNPASRRSPSNLGRTNGCTSRVMVSQIGNSRSSPRSLFHDGHFTIERIIRCELQNAQFAYLSACHTTVGDEDSPDEVMHLASAMQFAGFRSVIGTMWAVDDAQTNKITSVFYDNMMDESGHLDYTRAALALNKTMKLVDIPFDQYILYIHLGA